MTESEFNQLVDQTLEDIELALDEVDEDLDYELGGGVRTVTFGNGIEMARAFDAAHRLTAQRAVGVQDLHFAFDPAGNITAITDGAGGYPLVIPSLADRLSPEQVFHRVDGLPAGLYCLVRDEAQSDALRRALTRADFWQTPPGCPEGLPLYCLIEADARELGGARDPAGCSWCPDCR